MKKNSKLVSARTRRTAVDDGAAILEAGARLYNERRFAEMRALLAPALEKSPEDPGLNSLMGQVTLATGDSQAALGHFEHVLRHLPNHPELLAHRAMCLLKLGRRDEAKDALEAVLALAPQSVVTLKYLGALHGESGAQAKAEEYLRRALLVDPNEPEVLCLLGKTLLESKQGGDAHLFVKRAIKLRPQWATPFNLLGAIFRQRCRFRTALSCYRRAWLMEPNDLGANVNYGVGLLETGRVHEAITQFRQFLATDPSCDQARFNMATALLQIGQLQEGWEAYDARRKIHRLRDSDLPYPDWQGEPITDKNILVLAEQGIGDEIWAASMFGDLIALAEHCIFECEPRLVTLFKRSFPQATITPRLAQAVSYPKERPADVKLPAMSLARWLRVRPEQFPGKVGYLIADPERQEYWRWRIGQLGHGLKVGISWRSMNLAGTRNDSYTALSQWADILAVPGVHFVNLQYGDCQSEIDQACADAGVSIHNFRDIDLKDGFDDVAALIGVLDAVIAPDNTVGAMAGALNVPVLQFVPSKYWSCHGHDYHPWFPSAKLFFRPWDHTWDDTLRALANELARRSRQAAREDTASALGSDEERKLLRTRVERGALFFISNQPERAKAICLEILSARPRHSDALLLLGAAERKLGNGEAAERSLLEAISIDPLLADAQNLLGAVYLDRGVLDKAENAFLQALEVRPGFLDALNNLGSVAAARTDYSAALRYYRTAIDTFSGFVIARYNLATALDITGDHDEALIEYLTVVEADPCHADAWNNLGILYGRLGRMEDSEQSYRKALALKPDDAGIKINCAKQILRGSNDRGEAVTLLVEAAKVRPDDSRLFNTLGVAYATQENFENARENFQRAIDLQGDYADAYRNLGIALQKLGRLEEARDVLLKGKALAVDKNSPPLH